MKSLHLRFVAALLLVGSSILAQNNPPVTIQAEIQTWIATTDEQWQAAFKRDVTAPYEAEISRLKLQYLTSLDEAIKKASAGSDLDGAVSLRNEQKRFTDTQSIPERDDPSDSGVIRQLRDQFRIQATRLNADRVARAKQIHAKYDQVLAQAQAQLTQRQRLDDALIIKAKRELVASAWIPTAHNAAAEAAQQPSPVQPSPQKPKVGLNDPDRGWFCLFRSSEPTIWNTDASVSPNHFALSLEKAPKGVQWLRFKRVAGTGGDYLIIPIKVAQLNQDTDFGKYTWNGTGSKINGHTLLGIGNKKWDAPFRDSKTVSIGGKNGWGFGTSPPGLTYPAAAFAWKGQKGDLEVIDISVKATALTTDESNHVFH